MSDTVSSERSFGTTLTGELSRRVAKYATDEERQQAKLMSYKKYASNKYHCGICNKTMSIYSYADHIKTNLHNKNFLLYQNTTNK
jgi:hypothetical protein